MMNKTFFLFYSFAIVLAGCKKNTDIKKGEILRRVIHHTSNTPEVDTFIYDDNYRLVGVRHTHNPDYDKAIQYDFQGRLIGAVYSYHGVDKYSVSFVYNASGQIVKKIAQPIGNFDNANNESYAYDNLGRVIADSNYYRQTDSVLNYHTLKYGSNGNVVEDNYHNLADPSNQGKTTYLHDNNRNPFKFPEQIYFYVAYNYSGINNNNIIEIKPWWPVVITNQYEYKPNGFPQKSVFTMNNFSIGITFRTLSVYEYGK
jgi:hypothetical protein